MSNGLFSLWACAVCFGDPNSNLTKGAVAGVLFLLAVTAFVLTAVGFTIFSWSRRAKKPAPSGA